MKKILISLLMTAPATLLTAQTKDGGISPEMLESFRAAQTESPAGKAIANALASNAINTLALVSDNPTMRDTHFSHRVASKGITNQKQSGRCWLFTGLNVMRAKTIAKFNLGTFQFSQSYCFFYDQLEKANLFLQATIDNASKPMDDQLVTWLFQHPLSDGGQFTGVQDIITKYGVVPADVMPERYSAENTSTMAFLLSTKLREYGLTLRKAAADGEKKAALAKRKGEMLATVYKILAECLGQPPVEFTWTRYKADGTPDGTKTYTPLSFYKEYVGADLQNNYVMLMNDPTRPYHKTYTIDMDRHAYDGSNWTYLNLPMDEIKAAAIASIKDSTMLYYSCDVAKFLNRKNGTLDPGNYDYASLFETAFPMNKAERISTYASASSHAMTLMAVDLDTDGNAKKWMVENSWGADNGYQGHLIMSDTWFDEYTFRLVVERKYLPESTLRLLDQKPERLPAWDPLFAPEP